MSIQNAGQLQDAVNLLVLGRDIHIHVWDVANLTNICFDPPIVHGTGSLTVNNNDVAGAGPGANSVGWRIQGTLDDLINGGKVRFKGAVHFLFLPDGSLHITTGGVDLHPIGKK